LPLADLAAGLVQSSSAARTATPLAEECNTTCNVRRSSPTQLNLSLVPFLVSPPPPYHGLIGPEALLTLACDSTLCALHLAGSTDFEEQTRPVEQLWPYRVSTPSGSVIRTIHSLANRRNSVPCQHIPPYLCTTRAGADYVLQVSGVRPVDDISGSCTCGPLYRQSSA
jgi:hypothetical protein